MCKQGQTDVELNETGRQQAVAVSCFCCIFSNFLIQNQDWILTFFILLYALMSDDPNLIPVNFTLMEVADRLSREPKISAIYSSDLQRAFETAQIIASRCGRLEV